MNNAEKEEYEKILEEILKDNQVLKFFNATVFMSWSKGKNKKRKNYFRVILLKQKSKKEWFSLNENGFLNGKKYLFDTWATEIFGQKFCACLNENPGEYLRRELLNLLEKFKRF